MSDRNDRSAEQRPAQRVRIIGAEEARRVLDTGRAAGRRPDDQLGSPQGAGQGGDPTGGDDPSAFEATGPLPFVGEAPGQSGAWAPSASAEDRPRIDPSQAMDELARGAGAPLPSAAAGSSGPGDADPGGTPGPDPQPGYAEGGYEPGASGYGDNAYEDDAYDPTSYDDSSGEGEAYGSGDYDPVSPRVSPPPEPDETGTTEATPEEDHITVTGSHRLPHWTEAAGEVPPSLIGAGGEDTGEWAGASWRHEHDLWGEEPENDTFLGGEGDEDLRVAAENQPGGGSDIYSFDEAFQQLEEERSGKNPALFDDQDTTGNEPETGTSEEPSGAKSRIGAAARRVRGKGGSQPGGARVVPPRFVDPLRPAEPQDLVSRVAVGIGMVALLLICYFIGSIALVIMAGAGVVLAAAEVFGILQRCGFRPATLLGLASTAGFMFAAYWKGGPALPLIAALTFAAIMVWYLLGIVDARPLANVAVTAMAVLWVGLFGSFAALMLRAPNGRGLFLGVVAVTVAFDIVSFFAGRQFGRRLLAPSVSPGKTVEGLVAGVIAALVIGLVIGKTLTPWGGIRHGLELGVVVAVLAPVGDLFESLIKRDLSVKDSGTVLAGHGGLLDRIDSLLLVLPAAYYLVSYVGILK